MIFAGETEDTARSILHLHGLLSHSRQSPATGRSRMPPATYLRNIELLSTDVLPRIRKELRRQTW
jgi:hypothetical protein